MNAGKAIFEAIADFSQVRREARRTRRSLIEMNQAGKFDTFKGVAGIFLGWAGALAGVVGKMAVLVPLLGAGAGAILALLGGVLGLVGGLAPLAGLLAPLPGMLAGLGVGALAFALAMKDAKTQLAELGPLMKQIQKDTSGAFWANAAGPLKELGHSLLPEIAFGMSSVGSAVGLMTARFATGMKQFLTADVLGKMFDNTAQGAANAAGAMIPMAHILETLGTYGTQFLPKLGQWFTDITIRFDNFLSKAAGGGAFEVWVSNGLRVMRELGTIIGSVGSILGSLFKAAENAAPGNTLTLFAGALQKAADVLARPEVQTGLVTMFAGAQQSLSFVNAGLDHLFAVLGQLGGAFMTVMVGGGAILGRVLDFVAQILAQPAVGSGIISFMDGLQKGVEALEPAMKPIGDLIGALLPLLGEMAKTFGGVLGPAIAIIAPILTDIAKTLTPIVPELVALAAAIALVVFLLNMSWIQLIVIGIVALVAAISFLVQNWDAVVNTISVIWGGFLNWCVQVIDGFVAWWNQVWGGFGNWLGEIWGGMVNGITDLWNGFVGWVMGVVDGFVAWWQSVWNPVQTTTTDIFGAIGTFFAGVWQGILDGVNAFVGFFIAAWQSVLDFLSPLFPVFDSMFNAFGAIFGFIGALVGFVIGGIIFWFTMWWNQTVATMTAIWTTITTIWQAVSDFINGALQFIWGIIVAVWTAVFDTVSGFLTAVWNVVVAIWTAVGDFINGALSWIWGIVVSIWSAVLGFIGGVLSGIWGWVSSIWGSIMGYLGGVMSSIWGIIVGAWNGLLGFIGSVMSGIWGKVTGAWNDVIGWLGGIGGRILGAIGDLGSILWNAGTSIIQGLLDGLKSMWDNVAGFFKQLTDSIPSWKGPKPRDKTLLKDAGLLVMGGFLNALESQYGKVRDSLGEFTSSLADQASVALTGQFSGGLDPAAALGGFGGPDLPPLAGSSTYTPPAASTGGPQTVVENLNITNPVPEKASDSLPRAIRKLGGKGTGNGQ